MQPVLFLHSDMLQVSNLCWHFGSARDYLMCLTTGSCARFLEMVHEADTYLIDNDGMISSALPNYCVWA